MTDDERAARKDEDRYQRMVELMSSGFWVRANGETKWQPVDADRVSYDPDTGSYTMRAAVEQQG